MRNDIVQKLSRALVESILRGPGLVLALLVAVLRQVAHQLPSAGNRLNIVLEHLVTHA